MTFLMLSYDAEGLGLAHKLKLEGHQVNFLSENNSGMGLIDHTNPQQPADITLTDSHHYVSALEQLSSMGHRALGSSRWSNIIDNNPKYVKDLLEANGFSTESGSSGINLYTTLWFNGQSVICSYNSFVYRRFMSNGCGPDIGFTGSVTYFSPLTQKMWDTVAKPFIPILKRVNHRGPIHIHLNIKNDTLSIKEISAKLCHPLSYILFENSKSSAADVLSRLTIESKGKLATIDPCVCSTLVSLPPFPHARGYIPVQLKGLPQSAYKHLWMVDVNHDQELMCAGGSGKLGYVTARGEASHEAMRRIKRTLANIQIRDLQYRDDIGRSLGLLTDNLVEHGWITKN